MEVRKVAFEKIPERRESEIHGYLGVEPLRQREPHVQRP